MKITRYKHARRYLGFYKNVFGFREPHLVVVDGTFTYMALRHQTNIKEQLPKYLNGEVQLLTTKCAIAETESLGSDLYGAAAILKRYKILSCPHRDKPIPAAECFKTVIGHKNDHHYYIATQDPELTGYIHSVPGTPLLYMNMNAIILEKPSAASQSHSRKVTEEKTNPPAYQKETLKGLKGGEEEELGPAWMKRKRRRRPKEPNPLSVKKKKKTKVTGGGAKDLSQGDEKTGRKRRRKSTPRSPKVSTGNSDVTVR